MKSTRELLQECVAETRNQQLEDGVELYETTWNDWRASERYISAVKKRKPGTVVKAHYLSGITLKVRVALHVPTTE